jgi:hypothetical protein
MCNDELSLMWATQWRLAVGGCDRYIEKRLGTPQLRSPSARLSLQFR